jgi:pimeloyl-ACP methyl ester carboxylesterase
MPKLLFVFLLLGGLALAVGHFDSLGNFKPSFVEQPVDHFSDSNTDTFQQLVLVDDSRWRNACGAVLFIPGYEYNVKQMLSSNPFPWNSLVGNSSSVLIVAPEHRYTGLSQPYFPNGFGGKNISFLFAEQAMMDHAMALKGVLNQYGANDCPVVSWGCSYGGKLALWMRMKFPFLVTHTIGTSAPVASYWDTPPLAFDSAVSQSFSDYNATCYSRYRTAFAEVMETIRSQGAETTAKLLGFCPQESTTAFFVTHSIRQILRMAVQTNIAFLPNASLKRWCNMSETGMDLMRAVLLQGYGGVEVCYFVFVII